MNANLPDASAAPERLPAHHPELRAGRIGVLIVNLGTPEATDYWSMRRYLKEFLSDRRVVEVSRLIWWPLLNLVILSTRPGRRGKDYARIWNNERNEGPLKTITRGQAEKLSQWLAAGGLGEAGAQNLGRLGHALRPSLDPLTHPVVAGGRLRPPSSACRSIRNMRRRRRRRSATRSSTC